MNADLKDITYDPPRISCLKFMQADIDMRGKIQSSRKSQVSIDSVHDMDQTENKPSTEKIPTPLMQTIKENDVKVA